MSSFGSGFADAFARHARERLERQSSGEHPPPGEEAASSTSDTPGDKDSEQRSPKSRRPLPSSGR